MDHNPFDDTEEFSDEDVRDILAEALSFQIKEKRKIPRRNILNKTMIAMVSEFLTCFKIIGYDIDGNPVNITSFSNKMERDALDCSFMDEVSKYMSNKKLE